MKLASLFRPEVQKIKAYQLKSYPELIKLNQNELPFELPEKLKTQLARRLQGLDFARYPQVRPQRLTEALARGHGVEAEQILVSNGSNVLIQALVMAAARQQEVLLLKPSFSVYADQAELLGNRLRSLSLGKDFSLPRAAILRAFENYSISLTFIANPNAPTGNLFSDSELLEVIAASPGLIVIDEAYAAFSKTTLLKYLEDFPQLILLRTLSKGLGLGGVRLGYLIAHPELVIQVNKVLLPYCVSSLSEEVGLFALEHEDFYAGCVQKVIEEKDRLFQSMQKLAHVKVYPSQANYLLFQVPDADACFEALVKAGILIRNVSHQPGLSQCLRVSIGKPEENITFLKALKKWLAARAN